MTRVYVGGLTDRASERELDDEVRKRVKKKETRSSLCDGKRRRRRPGCFFFSHAHHFLPTPLTRNHPPVRPLWPHPQHLDRSQAPRVCFHRV